jgi:hypothetical protein
MRFAHAKRINSPDRLAPSGLLDFTRLGDVARRLRGVVSRWRTGGSVLGLNDVRDPLAG